MFEEKLDLFSQLVTKDVINYKSDWRTPLEDQIRLSSDRGGQAEDLDRCWRSSESVIRAVRHDMRLILAIIGGNPHRFVPYVDLYRKASEQAGRPVREIGVHSPGYVAESDEQARRDLFPHFKKIRDRLGRERGWPPVTERDFENEIEHGSLYAGSPETAARKIAKLFRTLGISRFQMKYSAGPMEHEKLVNSIELYGTNVIPLVRSLLSKPRIAGRSVHDGGAATTPASAPQIPGALP